MSRLRGFTLPVQLIVGSPCISTPTCTSHRWPLHHTRLLINKTRARARYFSPVTCVNHQSSHSSSSEGRLPLAQLCHTLEFCFFEICVRNLGRPAGLALHGFVTATVKAALNGYTRDQVSLQIMFGSAAMNEFELGTAGCTLTATEEHYRSRWLDTVYTTLQMLEAVDKEASSFNATEDMLLHTTIHYVIEGQRRGNEQYSITFDRGLATRGASGGLVAENVVIAPQWVPVSQLVLLTMKVVNELQQ